MNLTRGKNDNLLYNGRIENSRCIVAVDNCIENDEIHGNKSRQGVGVQKTLKEEGGAADDMAGFY
jgi:hypothetical protein